MAAEAEEEGTLVSFFYMLGGEMKPISYEITYQEDGEYLLTRQDGAQRIFDAAFAKELEQALLEGNVLSWDGFYGNNACVLDGETFSLEVAFGDGRKMSAYGNNEFPQGYGVVSSKINDILRREEQGYLAGTYRYEGEGFGSDFVITLNADGTYHYYEGALSSYIGGGYWDVFYGAIYMYEENGLDRTFVFACEEGALLFCSADTDNFLYLPLADGARFLRVEEQKGESMLLLINDTQVPVRWEDNASVAQIKTLLPLTIHMSMYGGFEQVGAIGQGIVRDDRQTTTSYGDIVLYAGNQIVIFYGSNSWSYTRLGHIDLTQSEMRALLANGDVTIKLIAE